MEFWGVEVKSGQSFDVKLDGGGFLLHLSQACLGEIKKDKANESVCLLINIDGKKLVLGTLHSERLPQQLFDLVFDKDFQLSHNWKNGSVYFYGYKADDDKNIEFGNDSDISESDEDDHPVPIANGKEVKKDEKPGPVKTEAAKGSASGKQKAKLYEKPKPAKTADSKASASGKHKVKIVEPVKDDESDSDESEDSDDAMSEDSDSEEDKEDSSADDDMDNDDSDDEEDEETPKKQQSGKKRASDSAIKTPGTGKKPMLDTPQKKTGGVHVDTPHPLKKKSSGGGEEHSCKSCNRKFKSGNALESHNQAKHKSK